MDGGYERKRALFPMISAISSDKRFTAIDTGLDRAVCPGDYGVAIC